MRLRAFAVIALTLLAAAPRAASADTPFVFDPKTTSVSFTAVHLALAHVPGTIPVAKLTLSVADDGLPSSVQVVLDMKGIDTRNSDRDADLRSSNWFQVDKYPVATFTSTGIDGKDPAHFRIFGTLALHGVTKPIVIDAHLVGQIKEKTGRRRVGYEGTTHFDRHDFNIWYPPTMPGGDAIVSADIPIVLQIEAVEAAP
jgi:polyisoprenoid-binding protein YceI